MTITHRLPIKKNTNDFVNEEMCPYHCSYHNISENTEFTTYSTLDR